MKYHGQSRRWSILRQEWLTLNDRVLWLIASGRIYNKIMRGLVGVSQLLDLPVDIYSKEKERSV
jgi:hypothetical protein